MPDAESLLALHKRVVRAAQRFESYQLNTATKRKAFDNLTRLQAHFERDLRAYVRPLPVLVVPASEKLSTRAPSLEPARATPPKPLEAPKPKPEPKPPAEPKPAPPPPKPEPPLSDSARRRVRQLVLAVDTVMRGVVGASAPVVAVPFALLRDLAEAASRCRDE